MDKPISKPARPLAVAALLLGLAMLLVPGAGFCSEGMNLTNLVLDNQAGRITVRFGLGLTGYESLEKALDDGASVEMSCRTQVERKKGLWADTSVGKTNFISVVHKDGLTREYSLTLPDRDAPLKGKDLEALLIKGWDQIVLDLGPWKGLVPDSDYRLTLDVSLMVRDVPAWLRYMVFFWSWEVLPGINYQLDFSY